MNFKKILIILVPSEKAYLRPPLLPPLSMGMLKGYLKTRGFLVQLVDLNTTLAKKSTQIPKSTWEAIFNSETILSYLRGEIPDAKIMQGMDALLDEVHITDFDIVGISTGANLSFFEIHFAFILGKLIKQRWNKDVVFGGGNIQYLLEFKKEFQLLWQAVFANFSYFISGPGELAFAQLLEKLNNGDSLESIHAIPGILAYKDMQVNCVKQNKPFLGCPDFDSLNLGEYSLCHGKNNEDLTQKQMFKWSQPLPVMHSEKNRTVLDEEAKVETPIIPYIFNYGCPYQCAFCAQSSNLHPGCASRNASLVVEDIANLVSQYGSSYFYFFNNAFNISRKFVLDFCEEVKSRHLEIYWSDCARFENLDKELLEKMYRAGCRKLVFGLESASNKLLKRIGKPIDREIATAILTACNEVGIWCDIDIITGLPGEDDNDFQLTYSFIEEHFSMINSLRINKLYILPSSELGKNPRKYGIKIHRLKDSYELLLGKSKKIYNSMVTVPDNRCELVSSSNCYLYSYSEIKGRSHKDVFVLTGERFKKLRELSMKNEIPHELR